MTITNRQNKTHIEARDPAWIEWTTGCISGLLVLALIGWLTQEALTHDDAPPVLSAVVNHVVRVGDLYRTDFTLVNDGPTSAAAVKVVATLSRDGSTTEEADVTFDYAPGQSRNDGTVYFRQDPAGGTLVIRPSSFTEP
ncbi:TIGR02588 family protein [Rhizobium helianthi]|uniref:TIGR02588 family protein n=1 Tax=Rhizobium helianthi TaxID=1132695 RepID=A0ABW4M266_9HYPH